jgi:hypothetical protein
VTWPAVSRDVDFADFVALETLRLFEPSLHAFIRHSPHRLTGLASDLVHDEDSKTTLGKEILDTVEPAGHERAKAALQRLFPKLESVWGNHGYASGFTASWDRERRVCIARRFPAYFGFGIGDDVLSRDELESFAANIADSDYVRTKLAEYASAVRRTGGTKSQPPEVAQLSCVSVTETAAEKLVALTRRISHGAGRPEPGPRPNARAAYL